MPLIANDVLTCAVGTVPHRLAVTLGEQTLTFGEVERRANRASDALLGLGILPGDRVAWWSDTALEGVDLYFGLSRIGVAFAPLNPAYRDDEVTAALEYLSPRLLVVDPAHAERAEQLVAGLDIPLATVGEGRSRPGTDLTALAQGASARAPDVPFPDEEAVCTIFLTSGSTGQPKGVMVSQRATWLRTHAGAAAHTTSGGRRARWSCSRSSTWPGGTSPPWPGRPTSPPTSSAGPTPTSSLVRSSAGRRPPFTAFPPSGVGYSTAIDPPTSAPSTGP